MFLQVLRDLESLDMGQLLLAETLMLFKVF
jgi:hypothetical protein